MVVKQVLDEADAARRGVREGDQLLSFAGRPVTSTNQYKNILGIYPKDWRVPLTLRRDNTERLEVLVRLMGNMAAEREQPPAPGSPAPGPGPAPKLPPAPKGDSGEAAKLYKAKKGYANWYFNELERDRLLGEFRKHGDFSALAGPWSAEGKYVRGDQPPGKFRFEVADGKSDPQVNLDLNIKYSLAPLKQSDPALLREPIGSGGLMMALYHYRRLLTAGPAGFEAEFAHGGVEPFYPHPHDGSAPKSLAELRVDCEVLRTRHASVDCKWYFSSKDHTLLGVETYITRDGDPCELYFHDYKDVGGRKLPHRIEVRYGDKRYGVLTVDNYTLGKAN
jgi:serine protease Do